MNPEATSRAFFEGLYTRNPDPWSFATSAYERKRYAAILRVLRHRKYEWAFEPGCSIGVLTEGLAKICESVEAMDISPTAVRGAIERCRSLRNVSVRCGALPANMPQGMFDLIVFSEIGYYFDEEALRDLGTRLVTRLRKGGVLLAVHWLGASEDHVLSGDQVHATLLCLDGLKHEHAERWAGFRLDRWVRT